MRILLCLALVLSGCGVAKKVRDFGTEPVPDLPVLPERVARPNFVAFEIETVLVGMDDGTQCRGTAGAALRPSGWSGVLTECPYPYPYAVELAAGTTAERAFLEEVQADLILPEGEVPFRPLVSVIITDTEGRRFRFQSVTGF